MGKSNLAGSTLWQRLAAWEWLLLALLLPVVLAINTTLVLSLLLLPALWLLRRLANGRFITPTPLDWSLFFLLLMVLVSQYATFDMAFSLPKIAGMVFGITLFYALLARVDQSSKVLRWGVLGLLLAGWGVAALSLVTMQWTREIASLTALARLLPQQLLALPGAAAAGVSPNQVAGTLLWITPLALALAPALPSRWQRLWAGATAVFFTVLIFFTQSRGGWLGLGAALVFMLFVWLWQRQRQLALTLLVVGLLAVGGLLWLGPDVAAGWLDVTAGDNVSDSFTTLNMDGRLEIWSRAIYGLQDFPLTGMGMNNFRRVVPILYPLFLISPEVDIAHAHNHWLQTGLDLGLPGLVAYLALWAGTAVMLWQCWHRAPDRFRRALALGAAASLLGFFVYGLFDTVALGARPSFIFWWLLGLVAASFNQVVGDR